MQEYTLKVSDTSEPESRLAFLNRLKEFLEELRNEGIIQGYALSTPYVCTLIFKVEAEG